MVHATENVSAQASVFVVVAIEASSRRQLVLGLRCN
jgi:hypothetical protein